VAENDFFITLYTDASFRREQSWARICFRGKCSEGVIQGSREITSHDVNHAEMAAILLAIQESAQKFPTLQGFFVNSDNKNCVQAFWTFKNYTCPGPALPVHQEIVKFLGARWIRAKHVKAHTGSQDIRSHMNRTVDRMTRGQRCW
jgi:ribonuclease HI